MKQFKNKYMSHTMTVSSPVIPINHRHIHRHCKHKNQDTMTMITFYDANEGKNPLSKCILD